MESETSAEFQSMFESKYERTEAVQKAVQRTSPQDKYRTQSWAVVDDAPGAAPPPPASPGKVPSEGERSGGCVRQLCAATLGHTLLHGDWAG